MNKQILLNFLDKLKENKKEKFWNITNFQGFILSKYIEILKPNNILEIGTSNGYSTIWLYLEKLENTKITTIEIDKKRFEIAKNNFKELKLENIYQINDLATNFLNKTKDKFDFVFIDANQENYEGLYKKLKIHKLIENNSTLIFENINSHNLKKFEKLIRSENEKVVKINEGGGFLVVKIQI
jgi:predicted O-methyltransferase YrrM